MHSIKDEAFRFDDFSQKECFGEGEGLIASKYCLQVAAFSIASPIFCDFCFVFGKHTIRQCYMGLLDVGMRYTAV